MERWAKLIGISDVDVLPAKPIHVALYLTCLVWQNSSSGPINFYSIRWAHSIVSAISHIGFFLVKNVLEGAKRRFAVPTKKKDRLLQNYYWKYTIICIVIIMFSANVQ